MTFIGHLHVSGMAGPWECKVLVPQKFPVEAMLWVSGSRAPRESRAGSQLILEGLEGFLEEVRFELRPEGLVSAARPRSKE